MKISKCPSNTDAIVKINDNFNAMMFSAVIFDIAKNEYGDIVIIMHNSSKPKNAQ